MQVVSETSAPTVARAAVERLIDTLRSRLGRRVLTSPAELAVFGSDALTAFHERPAAIILAESTDEVIETVRACHREGVPFVARGSGTSLSGGSLPIGDGVVI